MLQKKALDQTVYSDTVSSDKSEDTFLRDASISVDI